MGTEPHVFEWSDGTPVGFTAWQAGYPVATAAYACASITGAAWKNELCTLKKQAVCGAPSFCGISQDVVVSVLATTNTEPPATASTAAATLTYTPPVPTLALAPGFTAVSAFPGFDFDLDFTSAVEDLKADFVSVATGGAVLASRVLTGSGDSYQVTLELAPPTVPVCPPGFTSHASELGQVFCAKTVVAATFADADVLCSPHHLVTITSYEHNTFIADFVVAQYQTKAWCVANDGAQGVWSA